MKPADQASFSDLIARLLDEQLERSPALREVARQLATLALQRLDEIEGSIGSESTAAASPSASKQRPTLKPKIVEPTGVVPLRIGDAKIEVEVSGHDHALGAARRAAHEEPRRDDDTGDYLERTARARSIDLGLIATRCRLKAIACRHQIVRQNQERESPEELASRQVMNEQIAHAKTMPDCFLWMYFRKGSGNTDEQLEQIARCYEAMASAAELSSAMSPIEEWSDPDEVHEALQLLSTTCSALRVVLEVSWLTQPDIDQDQTHLWLRLVTAEHRFHVRRHMQLGDPADPDTDAPAARDRAMAMLTDILERKGRTEQAERLFKKALYHAQKIADVSSSPFVQDPPTHDCVKLNETVRAIADLRPDGLAAFARQIVRLAPPSVFPAEHPAHDLLIEAAAKLESATRQSADNTPEEPRTRNWSQDVHRVRELLRGGQIVMVGGEPRREAIDRMIDAFELESVSWPELSEHGTAEPMRAPIFSPNTKLVAVLIKLTGHEHAERAREFARLAEKPLVHMPAGYNPEQIASEVLNQASGQLTST